jgi:hypothetical protein
VAGLTVLTVLAMRLSDSADEAGTTGNAVIARFVGGERAAAPLEPLRQFMVDNNAVIMMIVLLLLGAKILGDGLTGLGL